MILSHGCQDVKLIADDIIIEHLKLRLDLKFDILDLFLRLGIIIDGLCLADRLPVTGENQVHILLLN